MGGIGPAQQNAGFGIARVFFSGTGASGQIATMYGFPGLLATRSATGVYDFTHPQGNHLSIFPGVEVPTGAPAMTANVISPRDSLSGTFRVHFTQQGTGGASGLPQFLNPSTGTVLRLLMHHSPVTTF